MGRVGRRVGAARVPARGERPEAGERVAGASLRRREVRRLPRQRRRDRRAAGRRRRRARSARPSASLSTRRCDGPRSNTNLGIVLLLAPLARAARRLLSSRQHRSDSRSFGRRRFGRGCGAPCAASSTRRRSSDARDVYAAIRRAAPGGLGRAEAAGRRRRTDDAAPRRDAAGRRSRRHRPRVRHRIRDHVRGRARRRSSARAATACRGTTRSSRRSCVLLAARAGHARRPVAPARTLAAERVAARAAALAAGGVRSAAGRARSTNWIAACATRATSPIPAPPRT